MLYYDTGVILKLYTEEPESPSVRRFVVRRKEPLLFHTFHRAESTSAFQLKVFRSECTPVQASQALADMEDDLAQGVLQLTPIDWDTVWPHTCELIRLYSAQTGCRTLDALHVACARFLSIREMVTTDSHQAALATLCGMRILSPSRK